MKNSLQNLFNILKHRTGSSVSSLQMEGLVSNMHITSDGTAILTLLVEKLPDAAVLADTERIFAELLAARDVFFRLVFAEYESPDPARYLTWAASHIERSNPIDAAVVRNSELTQKDEVYFLSSAYTADVVKLEMICRSIEGIFKTGMDMDISICADVCDIDARSASEEIYKTAIDEAAKIDFSEIRQQNERKSSISGEKNYKRKYSKKTADVIWGRFNTELPVSRISQLHNESGTAVFEGEIVDYEEKSVSNGTKTLLKFNISDRTSTIRCSVFMDPEKAEGFIADHRNDYLKVIGEVSYDFRFEKDLVARVTGIAKACRPEEIADNADRKRVELHCHTKMSSRDAVCDVKELINKAVHYGHSAIAITDHGVVQSFPDAAKACSGLKKKGKSIKLLYGMECYLSDDLDCVYYMADDHLPERGFVAVSLITAEDETGTKRSNGYNAVKFMKNNEGDYFQTGEIEFELAIPLKEGHIPEIFSAIQRLNDFIGDSAIASDDVLSVLSVLREEGFRTYEKNSPAIKFYGPAIDTLKLRKIFLKGSGTHEGYTGNEASLYARTVTDVFNILKTDSPEEINTAAGRLDMKGFPANAKGSFHCVLLAKSIVGLYGLYRLVSESHTKYLYRDRPRVPKSSLEFFRTGIIVGGACEAGEVFQAAVDHYDKYQKDYSRAVSEICDSEFLRKCEFYDYLEIQPIGNNEFMLLPSEKKGFPVPPKYSDVIDLKNINKLICEVSNQTDIPLCATGDVHFLRPENAVMRSILQYDAGYKDAARQPPLFFRTTEEMLAEFRYLGDDIAEKIVVSNPLLIADMIEDDLQPFPEGSFPPSIASAEKDVTDETWKSAEIIYGRNGELPDVVRSRIRKELRSIIGNGFAIMYYIAFKLVRKSNEDGYIVGSRGSVGSSFVAKLCGITEVNPLQPHYICPDCRYSEFDESGLYGSGYDLPDRNCPECGSKLLKDGQDIPFETFLGFEGEKQPDIDLNFSGIYQSTAHKYIEEMFGSTHTFRAGTITGFAEMNTAMMVRKYNEGHNVEMTGAEAQRLANGLQGVKRTTSQHPGGIVVVPKDREIYDFTPIQCPADKTESGIITTHFDFNSLHDTILKLDILGHDDPTMLKMLSDMTGIDVNKIDITDTKIMKLMQDPKVLGHVIEPSVDCGTLGLPEMGTFMARGMIKETKPSRFYDLVQLMGLSHGKDVWNGNARELIREGICSISDVIGCRDSIMTALMHKGLSTKMSFSIMEAVRKGKSLTEEQEKVMREHEVPQWYIESCKKIKYMFPKAHAVAYSISALRIAWFKIYRKTEYYCAYYTVRADDFDYRLMCGDIQSVRFYMSKFIDAFRTKEKIQVKINGSSDAEEFSTDKSKKIYYILELVEEMYCRGIKFLPLDIYKSDASKFIMEGENLIRPPLNTLPSVSKTVAGNIVIARQKHKRFISREDLAVKAGLGDSVLKLLDSQRCLDILPETTQIDIFSIC